MTAGLCNIPEHWILAADLLWKLNTGKLDELGLRQRRMSMGNHSESSNL
jgi:hypothetical protein